MVEQPAVNRRVAGSSPASGANSFPGVMYWVYILQNQAGKFYIGHTDNLQSRRANHNRTDKTLGKFTITHGPWAPVWTETQPTRSAAMARERQMKQRKSAHWIRDELLKAKVPI